MATSVRESSETLGDAAEAIGQALQLALGAGLSSEHTAPLRRGLSAILAAAKEAGEAQREVGRLTQRVDGLQRQSEQLLGTLAPALDVVVDVFNRAAQFKGESGLRSTPPDFTRRGRISDETLAAVLEAPGMAHQES